MIVPAAIRGEDFGLGTPQLASGEAELVLFLLGLLAGVLLMTAFFIYLSWRQSRRSSLPPETVALLDELADPAGSPPEKAADSSPPWEKPADWWKDRD